MCRFLPPSLSRSLLRALTLGGRPRAAGPRRARGHARARERAPPWRSRALKAEDSRERMEDERSQRRTCVFLRCVRPGERPRLTSVRVPTASPKVSNSRRKGTAVAAGRGGGGNRAAVGGAGASPVRAASIRVPHRACLGNTRGPPQQGAREVTIRLSAALRSTERVSLARPPLPRNDRAARVGEPCEFSHLPHSFRGPGSGFARPSSSQSSRAARASKAGRPKSTRRATARAGMTRGRASFARRWPGRRGRSSARGWTTTPTGGSP